MTEVFRFHKATSQVPLMNLEIKIHREKGTNDVFSGYIAK